MGNPTKTSLQRDKKFQEWYDNYRNSDEWWKKSSGRVQATESPIDMVLFSGPVKASSKAAKQVSSYIKKKAINSLGWDEAGTVLNPLLKTYSTSAVPMYYTSKGVNILEDNMPPPSYAFGGDLWKSSILGGGGGSSPYTALGTMGAGLVSTIDGMDGKTSNAGAAFSGALSMGATGAMVGGPIGAIAGGLLGAGMSLFQKRKEDQERRRLEREARELHAKQLQQSDEMNSQAILSQYPTKGISSSGFYKYGGNVQPQYQVEDGEVLFADDRVPPATDRFGRATRIAPNTFKFSGATHNHKSGGIGVSGGNTPYQDMYGDVKPSGFVLSDKLTTNSRKYLKNI